jgi:acyl-CoA thioesterase YciA
MWPYTTQEAEFLQSTPGPAGELAVRVLAMPADTNPHGNIFGGWIMSLMDSAGAITAAQRAGRRVVTVAVTDMTFLAPIHVGDVVCCYTDIVRIGTTSIALRIETWALRDGQGERFKVTSAEFTFVAVDDDGNPTSIDSVVRA